MSLKILEVNKSNYREIINLRVAKYQVEFIETVEECLKEADEYPIWRPVGIYDGDKPIGFAMYGLFIYEGKKGRVWLDRFLISAESQGHGYGRKAIMLLIDILYKEYGYNKIYLSVYDDNIGAIALYKKLGFNFNGEVDINGEKVMVLNLSNIE